MENAYEPTPADEPEGRAISLFEEDPSFEEEPSEGASGKTPSPQQRAVIEAKENRIGVIATAGAGKTSTLAQRLNSGSGKQVILSFSNAAANAIAAKLNHKAHFVGTLHGWCFRLLRTHGKLLGYRKTVSLITPHAQEALLEGIIADLNLHLTVKAVQETQSRDAELVWKQYRQTLKLNSSIDYDGLLTEAVKLLQFALVLEDEKVDELAVDEAQDSAAVDWCIYSLFPATVKLYIGDPSQSIFGFRGARPDMFIEALKGCAVYKMETNYRSGDAICKAAEKLIAHNHEPMPKRIISASGDTSKISFFQSENEAMEMAEISGAISRLQQSEPDALIAVLCRLNSQCGAVRSYLSAMGITVAKQESSLPKDWNLALSLVALFLDPNNDIAAEQVLASKLGATKARALKKKCDLLGTKLTDGSTSILGVTTENVCAELARNGVSPEAVQEVHSRLKSMLRLDPSLADLLIDMNRKDERKDPESGVMVLTMHSSKGREFDHTILPMFEEDCIPLKRGDLEEERRLAFVALTRARKTVLIINSLTRVPPWGGNILHRTPSRFITELYGIPNFSKTTCETPSFTKVSSSSPSPL